MTGVGERGITMFRNEFGVWENESNAFIDTEPVKWSWPECQTQSVTNVPFDIPKIAICPYCGTGLGIEEGELPPRPRIGKVKLAAMTSPTYAFARPRLGKQARAMLRAIAEKREMADASNLSITTGYLDAAIRAAVKAALAVKEEK